MAIVRGAPGAIAYSAASGTSISVPYPSSNGAGDKLVLIIGMKPSTANGGSVTTPSGWRLVTSITGAGGYGSTLGNDTGNTNLFVFERIVPAGGLTGNLTVTVAANNICWGMMEWLTTDSSGWQNSAATTGSDVVGNTVFGVNFPADPGVKAGDFILVAACIPTDVTTPLQFSGQSLAQDGVTFGAFGETGEPDTSLGSDIGGWLGYAPVDAGSSSAAPYIILTVAGTTTNVRGPAVFVRVRDAYRLSADTGAFAFTGENATLIQTISGSKTLQADAGTFALTGLSASLTSRRAVVSDFGVFNITGASAAVSLARTLVAQAAILNINGLAATPTISRYASASAGSFSAQGQEALLTKVNLYFLDGQPTNFTIAGQDADLTRVKVYALDAQPAALTSLGQTATLVYTQTRQINAEVGSSNVTGLDATLTKVSVFKLIADAATVAYSGAAATLSNGRILNAQPEAMQVSGLTAGTYLSRNANAQAAAFAYNGQNATLTKINVYGLNAQPGSYAVAGVTANVLTARTLSAQLSPFDLGGSSVDFFRGAFVNATAAAYTVTGQEANLKKLSVFPVQAETGSYVSTGRAVQIQRSTVVQAAAAAVVGTGQAAQVRRSRVLSLGASALEIVGQAAQLSKGRVLLSQAGTYAGAGTSSQIYYDRILLGGTDDYDWQMVPSQLLLDRRLTTGFGSYSTQGQGTTALIAVSFEDANPYNVHIPARARHAREARAFCFHIPSRSRVIHEAIQ